MPRRYLVRFDADVGEGFELVGEGVVDADRFDWVLREWEEAGLPVIVRITKIERITPDDRKRWERAFAEYPEVGKDFGVYPPEVEVLEEYWTPARGEMERLL